MGETKESCVSHTEKDCFWPPVVLFLQRQGERYTTLFVRTPMIFLCDTNTHSGEIWIIGGSIDPTHNMQRSALSYKGRTVTPIDRGGATFSYEGLTVPVRNVFFIDAAIMAEVALNVVALLIQSLSLKKYHWKTNTA
jgi:hypothetical protein